MPSEPAAGGASEARRALNSILSLPDDAIDLGQAALLIAREEYPDLEVGKYLARLDEMAGTVKAGLRGGEVFTTQIAHLNRVLFDEMGFRGNREEYYDPRNSFLNDVLDRRVGIPISLSTVYLEVGRRIGCPLDGVAFPGHFLVRFAGPTPGSEILVDPFNRGMLLTEEDCKRRLKETYKGQVRFRPEFLRRARNRDILERMLTNLKQIYHGQRDYHRALRVQQMILCLKPDDPAAVRDRGLLWHRLACFGQAAADVEAYLRAIPEAPDAAVLRERLERLKVLTPVMN
jgi:regulator of sirC expression with transglutaminase-like and TPR domain